MLLQLLCLNVLSFLNFLGEISGSNYEDEVDNAEKITFAVPQISEEESKSDHVPEHLRCDACLAIVYQIYVSLEKQTKKKASKLLESEIIELLENVCYKNFDGYGLKQVNGENRLSGPGLETESVMAMTQMGGRWPHRLKELCHYFVGDIGEMEIYETFLLGNDALQKFFCYRKGIYGHCLRKMSNKIEL